jgi:hypothetical protein
MVRRYVQELGRSFLTYLADALQTPHECRPGDHYAPLPSVVGPMLPSPNLASSIYAPQAGADTSLPFRDSSETL